MHTKLEVFTVPPHSTWIVVEKFSSELEFESRTEPQIQFKVQKFY